MKRILWIDDEIDFLSGHTRLLSKFVLEDEFGKEGVDFELVAVQSPAQAREILAADPMGFDLIITDVDMPEMDGLELYQEIRRFGVSSPMIFCTAKAGYAEFHDRLEKITASDSQAELMEKPIPYSGDKDFDSKFRQPIMRLLERAKENPFEIGWETFRSLDRQARMELFEYAARLNRDSVSAHFAANEEDDWVVIAHKIGKVILSGTGFEEPSSWDLDKRAAKLGVPVFLYSRTSQIEEISHGKPNRGADPDDCGKWRPITQNDSYPGFCIAFPLEGDENYVVYRVDFDTGADRSFFSFEKLLEDGVIADEPTTAGFSGELWGEEYLYYGGPLPCLLGGKEKDGIWIRLLFRAVINWEKSPLVKVHQDRLALVGRNIFYKNPIEICLNGKDRVTTVRKVPDNDHN